VVQGSCLCGAVTFRLDGPLRGVVTCHCTQCRKTSGHFWAATSVPHVQFHMDRDEGLSWYQSSETARRGFCRLCGSSLFWEMLGEGRIAVAAGALDDPTGLTTAKHIFCASKGDYYDLTDGLPQHEGWGNV
jgi:hypothetical protein